MLIKIFAIAWNDIKIEFSYRSTYIFFLVLPILFTTVIGIALGNSSGSSRYTLPVVNLDGGAFAGQLLANIQASPILAPVTYPTEAEARTAFEQDSLPVLLVIPAGFTRDLQAGKTVKLHMQESPGSSDALRLEQTIQAAANRLNTAIAIAAESASQAEKVQPFTNPADRQVYFDSSLASAGELLANPPTRAIIETGSTQSVEIATGFVGDTFEA